MTVKPREGVDYSFARPSPSGLAAAKIGFAIRYLSWATDGRGLSVLDGHVNRKVLTRAEAAALRSHGIDIVSNWEYRADDQLRGKKGGKADANEAAELHDAADGPGGAPIFFSTDFDPSPAQLGTCLDYVEGCAEVIGEARVGVYGGHDTIKFMHEHGVRWLWQAYAWSTFGGVLRWHPAAQLRQVRNNVTLAGGTVDIDHAMTPNFGQWSAAGAHPTLPSTRTHLGGGVMLPRHGDKDGDGEEVVKYWQRIMVALDAKLLPKYGEDGSYGDEMAAGLKKLWKRYTGEDYSGREITSAVALRLQREYFKGAKGDPGPPGKDGTLTLPVGVNITGQLVQVQE